ncbi:MAG: methyl-accepting chemotaxis protein [Alphaproteobacteria bacterium]
MASAADGTRIRRALSLSARIPLSIVAIGMFVMAAVAGVSYWQAREALIAEAIGKLDAVVANRQRELQGYLATIADDLQVQASSPAVRQAFDAFSRAWNDFGDGQMEALQRAYITENPHPNGEKLLLDAAADGSSYSAVHAELHPWFRDLLLVHGYYDVFIFDLDGNLLYTVFKELDYATNLQTGEWKDTDLGNAFRAARDGAPGEIQYFDFRPYGPSYDAPAAFLSTPIAGADGTTVGVLVYQMPIDRFAAVMSDTSGLDQTGETFIVGADLLMRSDARGASDSTILQRSVDSPAVRAALAGETGSGLGTALEGSEAAVSYGPFDFLGTRWAFVGTQHLDEISVHADELALIVGGVAAGGAVLLLIIGLAIGRGVSRPITLLSDRMGDLATGNHRIDVPYQVRGDEIGLMARALLVFRDAAIDRERMQAERIESDRQQELAKAQALRDMADTIDSSTREALKSVEAVVATIGTDVTAVRASSDSVSDLAASVAAAAQEALANAQTVSAASEELSASIGEIHRQVEQSKAIAAAAVGKSDATQAVVTRLGDVGDRIGNVVQLIKEIAEQTNLLALNATIEAARAGDAGKGFAVVASEVKALAQETARSTAEIEQRVAEIREVSAQAAGAIEDVAETIREMDSVTNSVAVSVGQQRSATDEIARNVQESSEATRDVATQIAHVSDEALATRAAADSLQTGAGSLAEQVSAFGMTVTRLVRTSAKDTDRREHERFAVSSVVTVTGSGRQVKTTLLDVSEGGARLAASDAIRRGDDLTIEVPQTRDRWSGKVVGISPDGIHVAFEQPQAIDIARLQGVADARAA